MADKLTEAEKKIVGMLAHPVYTADYLEEWAGRDDNVFVNAPAALCAMGAKGYLDAVRAMAAKMPEIAMPSESAGA